MAWSNRYASYQRHSPKLRRIEMAKEKITYGTEVFELAADFCSDHPALNTEENRHELATDIQRAIDDFFADKE
jgi:hypothetical protein